MTKVQIKALNLLKSIEKDMTKFNALSSKCLSAKETKSVKAA